MCRGYFSSQEIDSHHATEHRSTDQSRNGCGMCCFCHAQPFEITRAKNIKNPLGQPSCQNAKVVQAFCSRRVHHRDRHQHTIPIALAALPGAILPRLRALALFGRRSPQRVDSSLVMPASENLHNKGYVAIASTGPKCRRPHVLAAPTTVGTAAIVLSWIAIGDSWIAEGGSRIAVVIIIIWIVAAAVVRGRDSGADQSAGQCARREPPSTLPAP